MIRFVFGRLASAVPTLFVVVTISFFLMRMAPGGPFNLERPLPPSTMANLMATYQLDQPLVVQYWTYLANVLRGDFGPSFIYRDYSVAELILQALPYSVTLGLWALAFAVVGGTIAGVVAALRQNGWVDYLVMGVATVGITVPNFVVGPVLSLVFAIILSLVPAGGWGDGSFRNLVLPVIALGLDDRGHAHRSRAHRQGIRPALALGRREPCHARRDAPRRELSRALLRGPSHRLHRG